MKSFSLNYQKQRLEYFKAQKAKYERKLKHHQSLKPSAVYNAKSLENVCSEFSSIISFYDDAIKAFSE